MQSQEKLGATSSQGFVLKVLGFGFVTKATTSSSDGKTVSSKIILKKYFLNTIEKIC